MSDSPKPKKKTDAKENGKLPMTTAEMLVAEEGQDKKVTRWAMGIAVIFHIVIFAMHWPQLRRRSLRRQGEEEQDLRRQAGEVQAASTT